MSALLDIVSEARELRREAEHHFLVAIRNAAQALDRRGKRLHTGREIARAASMSPQRISQILAKEEGDTDDA